jgi:monoterpene epsilon-lactone hydrolase
MLTWTTDDRPPTLWTRLYVRGMRLSRDKRAFEGAGHTLRKARQRQREGNRPPTRWTRMTRRVSGEDIAGIQVWIVRPRRRTPQARVVYVHGGGYIHPLTRDYWRLVRALARVPAEVVVPAYPLAPEATVDEVLPALLDVEADTAASGPALPTVLMGDSAGGALVLSMGVHGGRELRHRLVGIVALSPWLDATLQDPRVHDLEATDPMLAETGLRAAGRWWAGIRDPADPVVSPVNADLEDLPSLDLFIGDHDILRPAVDRFARRAEPLRTRLHVHECTSMFHVWMTRAIPEGRRTRKELVRLVRDRRDDLTE